MPARIWPLAALACAGAALAAASRQPLPARVVDVDARGTWAPPPGAGPALDSLLYPVWARQNLWRPWVQWADRPPRFDSSLTEAALVMATGARRIGEPDDVPDLYRENPDGSPRPFDPGHPFFRLLKRLKAAGIKPAIDLGPPPEALCGDGKRPLRKGAFDFHVEAPRDSAAYGRYFGFIRDLFAYLQGPGLFTRAELESWIYQLGREPDNRDAFDPAGEGRHLDPRNLAEYQRLYDYTLAGMRAAGVDAPLGFGNLAVPHDGVYKLDGTWAAPLMDWLASGAPSRCPHLKGPRFRPGIDTLRFSFSAYALSQMSLDPRDLGPMARKVRGLALARFPRNPVLVAAGEGGIYHAEGSHRGDATEMGAAWNAAIVKIAHDEGLQRYQQWGFVSAPHISLFEEHGGLEPPAYNVLRMYRMMQGGRLLPARVRPGAPDGAASGEKAAPLPYVDAMAVRRADGEVLVLCFRFDGEARPRGAERTLVAVRGLPPSRPCRVREYRVDRDHGNYFTLWAEDNGAGLAPRGGQDALMEYRFSPGQKSLWERNRERYRAASALAPVDGAGAAASTDADGVLSRRIDMPPNAVVLLRIAAS